MLFLIAITIYVTLRFEFKMAMATLFALLHDVLVTIGVYSITGLEVTPATVIAILTILGYSIYDGIVVFDKVDENTRLVSSTNRVTYTDMVNLSLNQTLMRSLNTPDHGAAADALVARGRLARARRHHAAGVRRRPAHRPGVRRLLVALHRQPGPRAS